MCTSSVAVRGGFLDCLHHLRNLTFDAWPACCEQDRDGNSAGARVLLVLEVAVRRDEDLEPSRFCRSDQQPILER